MPTEIGKEPEVKSQVEPTPPAEDKLSRLQSIVEGLDAKLEEIKTKSIEQVQPQPVYQPPQQNIQDLTQQESQAYENIRLTQGDYQAIQWANNQQKIKESNAKNYVDQYWDNAVAKNPQIANSEQLFKSKAYGFPAGYINDQVLSELLPYAFGNYALTQKSVVQESPKPTTIESAPEPTQKQANPDVTDEEFNVARKFGYATKEAYAEARAKANSLASKSKR
jgi:hypothetical protein